MQHVLKKSHESTNNYNTTKHKQKAKRNKLCVYSMKWTLISRVSCQKGPTRHAYAWQIGPFWQDTLDINQIIQVITTSYKYEY